MFRQINQLDLNVRRRVERVASTALAFGDRGIVEWAGRAVADALALGKLRDRDVATLQRLEDTYGHDYYNTRNGGNSTDGGAFVHA